MILIESDLLLAIIKKDDRLKPIAVNVLEGVESGKLKGFYASTAAIQEVIFWFYNRGLFGDLSRAVNILTHLKKLELVPLTPYVCFAASLLIKEYGVSPFDAYHAATAILKDKMILSTDHVYDKIKGIERIEPSEFV